MLRPCVDVSGLAVNQSEPFDGLIALKPPSPPSTFSQLVLVSAEAVAGEPLSCVPPSNVLTSVGCTEKDTNCVIEPRVEFRLSNWLLPLQLPVVRPP